MTVHLQRPKWLFYPEWVALHILSVLVALGTYLVLISLIGQWVGDRIVVGGQSRITEDYLLPYIFWPVLALANGLLQALLLRRWLPRIGWWVVATALGWSLGLFGTRVIYSATALDVYPVLFGLARALFTGGIIGLAQWLVLRKRVPRAGWRILANVLGWGVSALFSRVLDLWVLGAPALVTVVGWWLLLDMLPSREAQMQATRQQVVR